MNILTLTPSQSVFAATTLLILAIASTNIAGYVYCRYCQKTALGLIDVNVLVKAFILGWGLFTGVTGTFPVWNGLLRMTLGFPSALLLGWLAIVLDRRLIRFFHRRSSQKGKTPPLREVHVTTTSLCDLGLAEKSAVENRAVRLNNNVSKFNHEKDIGRYGLVSVSLVAVLEELLFRGILVNAIFLVPGPSLKAALLLVNVFLFGLVHLSLGWDQVMAKTVLGALTTFALLVFGSLVFPILIHLFINIYAYQENKNR